MMNLKKIYTIIFITVILAFSLTGCGSNKAKAEAGAEVTATPTEALEAESGDKDTGDFTEEEIPQTALEDIEGEGMTDKEVPDLEGIEEAPIMEPVVFTDEAGADLFSLTINSIEGSDTVMEDIEDATSKKMILVDYSFENVASDDLLLFDDMSFKLVVGEEVAMPYFGQDLTAAEAVEKGNGATGELAFIVEEDVQEAILVFDNAGVNAKAVFKVTIQ